MSKYVEMQINKQLYNRLQKLYEKDDRNMTFDEFVNYLLKLGLEND